MKIVCPYCNKVTSVNDMCSDFIHNCGENETDRATTKDDVVVIGPWEDYSGSGSQPTNFYLGVENKLQGTLPGAEGEDVNSLTRRGNNSSTHRQRDHLEFIEVKR